MTQHSFVNLTIRQASKEDQKRLGALWLALLQEQAALDERFGVATDALERWTNDFPFWLHDEGRRFLVAEDDEKIIGFLTAQRWSPSPIYAEALEVFISELYVVPEARQQHAGAELVAAVRTWAETLGARRLRIGVLAANEQGQAFWQQQEAVPFSVTYTLPLKASKEDAARKPRHHLGF